MNSSVDIQMTDNPMRSELDSKTKSKGDEQSIVDKDDDSSIEKISNFLLSKSACSSNKIDGALAWFYSLVTLALLLSSLSLLTWFFIDFQCINSQIIFSGRSTKETLDNFINQEQIYFCGASYEVVQANIAPVTCSDPNLNCYIDTFKTVTMGCGFEGVKIDKVKCDGNEIDTSNYMLNIDGEVANCGENVGSPILSYTIAYSQCMDYATAVSNSLNYSMYTITVSTCFFLLLKFIKMNGLYKVFNQKAWSEFMNP